MSESIKSLVNQTISLARSIYGGDFIPLHRPVFEGNERQYLVDCIDSNFVSSVGAKVTEFEQVARISHNVEVGKDAMIFALTVICGGSTIGERSKIAPGASVINKVSIGDHVQVRMGAVVTKNIVSNCVVIGNPARKIR